MTAEHVWIAVAALAVVAGLAAVLVWAVRAPKETRAAWEAFASNIGTLRCVPDDERWPRLEGTYQDIEVLIRMVSYGSSESRTLYTRVTARCRRKLANDFELRPQGALFALQHAFGAQDIQIGDPELDRRFVVKGADEGAVRALLADAGVRHALTQYAAAQPGLAIADGSAVIEMRGQIRDPARLSQALHAATGAVLALETAALAPAMQYRVATATTQRWLLQRSGARVFAAVMMFPLGLGAIVLVGSLVRGWIAFVAIAATALVIAGIAWLIFPRRPALHIDGEQLVFEQGSERVILPLRSTRWWCGPWRMSGYPVGSLLYLQAGDRQVVIGGAQYFFTDPGWYQAAPGDACDGAMRQQPFGELLTELGYAIRRLQQWR